MNLENYFYVFEGAVPLRLCDDLVTYGEQQASQVALTGGHEGKDLKNQKDISKLYKTRNSSIVWMNDSWIYNSIIPLVNQANREAGWNFEWSQSEDCQWTKYAETQHYTWHQDAWDKPYPKNGLIRKLSVTVSLADGDSYEGGDLEFDLRNRQDSKSVIITSKAARKKGSVIVFPSFVWHRVAPVTKGIRYSLVIWNLGRPYL
tara:strand:- start:272 stop:880 length:609 start_codon:yes stop_codon:yes gene_type:complete